MIEISITHQDPPQQHARSTTATRYTTMIEISKTPSFITATRYTNMIEISLTHQDPPQQHAILI